MAQMAQNSRCRLPCLTAPHPQPLPAPASDESGVMCVHHNEA
jgi:hypothetical protein